MITDTTLRDGHQSLLATRMRTYDMLKIAPFINNALHNAFSLEMWFVSFLLSFLRVALPSPSLFYSFITV